MIRRPQNLWNDTSARIPFSLFGIFILLGSSITTVFLYDQGVKERDDQIQIIGDQQVEHLISEVEADISSMLNHISLTQLYTIGLNPVVIPTDPSLSAEEINIYRLKKAIINELQLYLSCSFQDMIYHDGMYAINVFLPDRHHSSLLYDTIGFETVNMSIHRPLNLPLISPPNEKMFTTYYTINVPLCFKIISLEDTKEITSMTRTISSVISSRYPLLFNLLNEYNETINGLGPFWGLTTILSNTYSLIRGYKHYQTGKPVNIVENKHIEPLINTCLLLENGFVFGSVDPFSIIDLASSIRKAVYNKASPENLDSFNNLSEPSFSISLDDFSTVSANIDADEPLDSNIDQSPDLNLSKIAETPLFTTETVSLCFKQGSSEISVEISITDESDQIQEVIMEYVDQGYEFTGFSDGIMLLNRSTDDMIHHIISQIYQTKMHLMIDRDDDPEIQYGSHDGYPYDNGTGDWSVIDTVRTGVLEKPEKGSIDPGSILYGEVYDVIWKRTHWYSRKIIEIVDNETISRWEKYETYDTRTEQNVLFAVILDGYSSYEGFHDDIIDIFYYNISVNDPNLIDAIDSYRQMIFTMYFDEFIAYGSGDYFTRTINASIPSWVKERSWNAIRSIYQDICRITQDESINSSTYPNPVILIQMAAEDLLQKYHENMTRYLQYDSYAAGSDFFCCGLKAEYCIRLWYVTHVEEKIHQVFGQIVDTIDGSFEEYLKDNVDTDVESFHQILDTDSRSLFDSAITIPLGVDLELTSESENGIVEWNESIRIAVNQFPKYLSAFEDTEFEGKKEYFLGIQNICLLGPTGMPILPLTPVTPWVVTLNLWLISVKGSYASFQITDCMDETVFHPLLGHQPISVLRRHELIYDTDGVLLGKNTRIDFQLDTLATSLVPAYGLMVGDMDGELVEQDGRGYE